MKKRKYNSFQYVLIPLILFILNCGVKAPPLPPLETKASLTQEGKKKETSNSKKKKKKTKGTTEKPNI